MLIRLTNKPFRTTLFLVFALVLNACGSSSDSTSDAIALGPAGSSSFSSLPAQAETLTMASRQGRFAGKAVSGLVYRSDSHDGVTSSAGEFDYRPGEQIEFYLGDIKLGETRAANELSLVELPMRNDAVNERAAVNLLRLLYTLDEDANADNGIAISTAVSELARLRAMNFDLAPESFEQTYLSLVLELTSATTAGAREFVALDLVEDELAYLDEGYWHLNEIRQSAGLVKYANSTALSAAAANHADYLVTNQLTGHYEEMALFGASGVSPADRAKAQDYLARSVNEVISYFDTPERALDDLMAAIYHRLALLSLHHNEAGIGAALGDNDDRIKSAFVVKMGLAEMDQACRESDLSGNQRGVRAACHDQIPVERDRFFEIHNDLAASNPEAILWPPRDADDIPPAFFEEEPDPLPDYSVSGYPVSVQFNQYFVPSVRVDSFRLFRVHDGAEIDVIPWLDRSADPNNRLSALEAVIFPKERLDWDTLYRVELNYEIEGEWTFTSWNFRTRALDEQLMTWSGQGQRLDFESKKSYAVYIPPTAEQPRIGSINYQYPQGTRIQAEFIDGNTLGITIEGRSGSQVSFTTGAGHRFNVVISN